MKLPRKTMHHLTLRTFLRSAFVVVTMSTVGYQIEKTNLSSWVAIQILGSLMTTILGLWVRKKGSFAITYHTTPTPSQTAMIRTIDRHCPSYRPVNDSLLVLKRLLFSKFLIHQPTKSSNSVKLRQTVYFSQFLLNFK